jgi:ElaB/YqjD/DUF883 family membrane-anchored ribosome-binding protein
MNPNQQDLGKSGATSTTSGAGASGGASSGGTASGGAARDVGKMARETVSKLGDTAQEFGTQAKQAATSLASEANENIKGVLNQKVGMGADMIGHVAESVRAAADNLKQNSPQLAGLVRGAADKIDEFASSTRDKTVEELFETASDFARRQPAVVFGAAAAAGFLLFRILKVAPSNGASQGASVRGPDGRFRDQPGNQEFGRTGMTNGQAASRRPGQTMGQRHGV